MNYQYFGVIGNHRKLAFRVPQRVVTDRYAAPFNAQLDQVSLLTARTCLNPHEVDQPPFLANPP